MTLLKGLIVFAFGLVGVIFFCGSVSGVVERGANVVYALFGAKVLLPDVVISVVWFAFFVYLAVFVGVYLLVVKDGKSGLLLPLFGFLHSVVPFCIFFWGLYLVSLCLFAVLIVLYLYFCKKLVKRSVRFIFLVLPYLLWLSYLFVALYVLTLLN